MELVPITPDQVKYILRDEELFSRVSEDGMKHSDYVPLMNKMYLGIFTDNTLIGYWSVEAENSITVNIHCNVLKQYRAKHSSEVGQYFVDYIFSKYEKIQKLNCKIPVIYPDVYAFAKKLGFKDEGIDCKSVMKGGNIVDRHNLGLKREGI